jgi:cytochrome P450
MKTSASVAADPLHSSARRVPGPGGQPLVGSMFDFQKDRLGFIMGLAREYGDVARYSLAHLTFYQVNHPAGVQRILQENNHNYVRGFVYDSLRGMVGNGLVTSDGDFWRRQRRLMQPVFHRQNLAAFGAQMTEAAREMLARWEPHERSGQPIELTHEITDLTMKIVTQALFSSAVGDETGSIGRAITVILEGVAYRFDVPFYPPVSVPTPRNRRFVAAQRLVDQVVYGLIEQRRKAPDDRGDLLSLLMEAQDADTGERMTDKQLHDEVLTLFIAGHETTANLLAWAFYLLSMHAHTQRQLHAEVAQVLGGRAPTMADLPQLEVTRRVIEETLRLYPPAWIFNRSAVEEDELCGYHIPAGAIVTVSPYVTHRLPEFWENPEGFDPERFSPELAHNQPRFAYFPFGGGPHQCIGQSFAQTEAQLILATIVQRYRLDLVPGRVVEPVAAVTLRPRTGLPMTLHAAG